MGSWGTGLFENDTGLEVKDEYLRRLQLGKSNDEAINETLNEFKELCEDEEDKIDFWFALSSLLYDYGRLTPNIRDKVLDIISGNTDELRWDENDKFDRLKTVEELKLKLLSEQPDEVKVKRLSKSIPKIKPNEIYYFILDEEEYRCEFFYNFYVYILVDQWVQKDYRLQGLGDEHALIYLKISDRLITDITEIDNIEFFNDSPWDREIRQQEDKRILMDNRGFSSVKKKLNYMGTFAFQRDNCNKIYGYDGVWKSVDRDYKGEQTWGGKSSVWSILTNCIVRALRHHGDREL